MDYDQLERMVLGDPDEPPATGGVLTYEGLLERLRHLETPPVLVIRTGDPAVFWINQMWANLNRQQMVNVGMPLFERDWAPPGALLKMHPAVMRKMDKAWKDLREQAARPGHDPVAGV